MSLDRKISVRILGGCLIAGLWLGCGDGTESAPAGGSDTTAAVGRSETVEVFTIEDEQGGSVDVRMLGASDVPEGLADDVPVFPGASSSGALEMPGEASFVSLVSSNPSGEEVFAFYQAQLPEQGWAVSSVNKGQRTLVATKSGRKLTLNVSEIDGRTEIGLMSE